MSDRHASNLDLKTFFAFAQFQLCLLAFGIYRIEETPKARSDANSSRIFTSPVVNASGSPE